MNPKSNQKYVKLKTSLVLLLAVLTMGSAVAQSDSVYRFDLAGAIGFGLKNNLELANSKLDVTAARKKVWETTTIGLPQVNASYNFQHLPGELPEIQFDPNMPPIKLGVANSATYDVQVSQLIFSGEYIVGLQASKTYLQISQNNLAKSELNIKESVAVNYYSILALETNKAILDTSVVNLEDLYEDNQALAEAGFIESTDADQIKILLNNTRNSRDQVQRQIDISYKLMKIALGLQLEDSIVLTQNIRDLMSEVNLENILGIPFKLEQNIDYRMLKNQVRVSELSLRREQSKFLPSVSSFYLYQDKTNKPDFDITFNHIIGVNVSVPIFSSGQRLSKVGQAKVELEKSMNTLDNASEQLVMQSEQMKYDVLIAYDSYTTQSDNIKLSGRVYEKTIAKYKEGVASSTELTQVHNQYLQNYAGYTNAMLNLLTSIVNYEKVYNKL